ncbi:hypothetical protein M3P05_19330 [Sansalvadorimonas sp. 2012CJ34-2]|uniref:Uncharacterized protein n=1 Tax=Parendozoicomonas callyspongiae TaxID=2942213 RepID=A0ABT0PL58_9GAMM|nr:hypothetical protein [Sansalvadorimonas sp. 2012CJ34-2]MCL6272078.1 hypothetical protein [Sansalvadorimonas sp. 2012CJ34-2]
MRPVDLETMINLVKMPNAPAVLCQAGYIFVNTLNLSRHPQLQTQLHQRLEQSIISEMPQCSGDGVAVYCMSNVPEHPDQIRKRKRAQLFTINH